MLYETHCESYLKAARGMDVHPELAITRHRWASTPLLQWPPLLVHGPSGVGKYTQVLRLLERHSPTGLKYEKRLTVATEKQPYTMRISDIHYEIDMAMLGCYAKPVFYELFLHVCEVVAMTSSKTGVIVCMNMHAIHGELLDVFVSYLQQAQVLEHAIHLRFVLVSEHVGFLPQPLLSMCALVAVQRPSVGQYAAMRRQHEVEEEEEDHDDDDNEVFDPVDVTNGKELYGFPSSSTSSSTSPSGNSDVFNLVCDTIFHDLGYLLHGRDVSLSLIREHLYDILVYNLDVHEVMWYLLSNLVQQGLVPPERSLHPLLTRLHKLMAQYNNNYRPIYHVENLFLTMYQELR